MGVSRSGHISARPACVCLKWISLVVLRSLAKIIGQYSWLSFLLWQICALFKTLFLRILLRISGHCRTPTSDIFLENEAVVWRCSAEKVFLEISQNSQENTFARASFLIKLQVCQSLFFNKVAGLRRILLQNISGGCFSGDFFFEDNDFRVQ